LLLSASKDPSEKLKKQQSVTLLLSASKDPSENLKTTVSYIASLCI
jgi:hypothetical protein